MMNAMKPVYTERLRKKGLMTCYAGAFGLLDDDARAGRVLTEESGK